MSSNIPPGPFPSDYLSDPLAIFDVYAASAVAGITSTDFDQELPPAGVASRAADIAMEVMRIRHCRRDKIELAMQGVTPEEQK